MKSYTELLTIDSYSKRLEYLKILDNNVQSPRHMSERFYKTTLWKHLRQTIIDRDIGFDLGVFGVYIDGDMIVHHINPITEHDIIHMTDKLTNPDNLITTSVTTHNKIHYKVVEEDLWVERKPGDTKLW